MDKDKKVWKDIWDSTDETLNYKDVFYLIDEIKLGYLVPLLPTGINLKTLEVGCGSARLSCFLASKGYKTTCLDYSESALRVARKNYKISNNNADFVIGDARKLPFENDTFDIVFSTGLLEHFKDPQIVIDEMVRVLKPNGIFYSDIVPKKFSTFRSPVIISKSLSKFARKDVNETFYEKKLNSNEIQKMLNSADLKDINVFGAGVFLPQIPYGKGVPSLKRLEYQFLSKIKSLFTIWDDTIIGDWLGFYYFVYAKK
ncbi:MAG: class I SAM-dependent methyltransferase [Methanobacteriaceae archaeon]|nr:class I SAM-dependent methyltransferase [Methanobacteriaceae archaeon]MDP2837621.1 class I SAM-dependent methyltransferase [Methanobacteriaceae archaeon]MDP3035252.1 class I SAM-dependent methyltransferase [Methanobacteriaceae archaeon]MDP3485757.1 class I SAM-dependent methyltransferase [Methanobacteriaceae archaeon]MDP3624723.1 class I SAM-dependent methyltransferase [Methanobacteriaceae archaeon]